MEFWPERELEPEFVDSPETNPLLVEGVLVDETGVIFIVLVEAAIFHYFWSRKDKSKIFFAHGLFINNCSAT